MWLQLRQAHGGSTSSNHESTSSSSKSTSISCQSTSSSSSRAGLRVGHERPPALRARDGWPLSVGSQRQACSGRPQLAAGCGEASGESGVGRPVAWHAETGARLHPCAAPVPRRGSARTLAEGRHSPVPAAAASLAAPPLPAPGGRPLPRAPASAGRRCIGKEGPRLGFGWRRSGGRGKVGPAKRRGRGADGGQGRKGPAAASGEKKHRCALSLAKRSAGSGGEREKRRETKKREERVGDSNRGRRWRATSAALRGRRGAKRYALKPVDPYKLNRWIALKLGR